MNENKDFDRREQRRKRRIRNQIISYVSVGVVFALIITGGIFAGRYILKKNADKKQAAKLEEEQDQSASPEEPVVISEPEQESQPEADPVDWLDEMVTACIAEMPLEDKVAGLFMITPEQLTGVATVVKAGDGTKDALAQYAVGGLIYFAQNIQSREQITQMLGNTVSYSKYPIFLGVDEEGGSVARVADSAVGVEKTEAMGVIGQEGDPEKARQAGSAIGGYLSELGFNVDFAPVADVLTDPNNKTIGDRSFGSDVNIVSSMVPAFVGGLEETGVSSCLKHFPGLGHTSEDTHEGMAVTNRTLDEMRSEEFAAFKSGIDAGADMVMAGHVSAPELTGDNTPCSLSKEALDILRGELGYQGIIVTDALNMTAVTDYYTSAEAAVKAVQAGADLLLMPEDFMSAYDGLLEAVTDGTITEERIDESLYRIYRVKYADRVEGQEEQTE